MIDHTMELVLMPRKTVLGFQGFNWILFDQKSQQSGLYMFCYFHAKYCKWIVRQKCPIHSYLFPHTRGHLANKDILSSERQLSSSARASS